MSKENLPPCYKLETFSDIRDAVGETQVDWTTEQLRIFNQSNLLIT